MACMRWDMTKAHCQHQCMPWTAASAMCTHRQLHRLVQPAYLLSQQLSHSSSIQRLASSATDLLPPAAQQSQQAPHTCRPLVSNVHNSGASRKLPVCYSTALSSSEATKTAAPGRDKPSTGGTGSNGDNGDDPFNANFGEAVLVLREDLPLVFQQDMRYHIFREDITFRTPSMAYLTGLWKYQLLHRGARLLGNLLYSDVRVTLARVWQPALDKKQLKVHWCVSGHPRLSLFLKDMPLSTEVISTYFFDSKGRIYEHQVDQLIPPESLPVKFLEWLVGRLQPRAIPQPQLPIPGA